MTLTTEANALESLTGLIHADLEAVERLLQARSASPTAMIPDIATHLIGAGGKRLRPMITLASAGLFGPIPTAAHSLAAAVEFIHSATLLHDDVVDDSDLRRGRTAARRIWGNAASILVGDYLFAGAFTLMVETGSLSVLDILSRASCVIAEGEVMQLAAKASGELSHADYLSIVEAKTAALFEASARAGAVIAGATSTQATRAGAYGHHLGMAFQLVDDALDYAGEQARIGKAVGDDFREGKLTLPVILARARGDGTDRAFWDRVLAPDADRGAEALAEALARIEATGARTDTLREARGYADAAKAALTALPAGPIRRCLEDIADFVVARLA